ncbi:uncharacterized protein LOC127462126 isoform X1 [Manacus candei]|uniref:uncharacterized protein LOC127462126 isoform X1 n=1 Tax=Manacus candei TaxID=415023 RepID=UPI002227F976|nr:uncharacterized protein LOC127462126 isoform X1 [Manacus candei]
MAMTPKGSSGSGHRPQNPFPQLSPDSSKFPATRLKGLMTMKYTVSTNSPFWLTPSCVLAVSGITSNPETIDWPCRSLRSCTKLQGPAPNPLSIISIPFSYCRAFPNSTCNPSNLSPSGICKTTPIEQGQISPHAVAPQLLPCTHSLQRKGDNRSPSLLCIHRWKGSFLCCQEWGEIRGKQGRGFSADPRDLLFKGRVGLVPLRMGSKGSLCAFCPPPDSTIAHVGRNKPRVQELNSSTTYDPVRPARSQPRERSSMAQGESPSPACSL